MTTVAYRDGILAADSLTTRGNISIAGIQKLFKSNTVLVGICGNLHEAVPFVKWVLDTSNSVERVEDFYHHDSPLDAEADTEALVVDRDGVCWFMHASGNVFKFDEDYAAAGSGDYFALGAMYHGASATEAVAASAALDLYTGGEINSISF